MLTGTPRKKLLEMSSRQIQKNKQGHSKALHGAHGRPLCPSANPMIRAKQLNVKETNSEGI